MDRWLVGIVLLAATLGLPAAPAAALDARPDVEIQPRQDLDEPALRRLLQGALPPPANGEWTIRILAPRLPLANGGAAPVRIAVAAETVTLDDPDGPSPLARGELGIEEPDGRSVRLPFEAALRAMVGVPVPIRPIAAGTPLTAELFRIQPWPRDRLDQDDIQDLARLEGSEAARRLGEGRPVAQKALRPPRAIRRGELVTVSFERRSMRLTLQARALDDAAIGEPIRLSNLDSNRQFTGMVTGPGEAAVGDSR